MYGTVYATAACARNPELPISDGEGFFAVDLVPLGKYDARNPYF